MSREDGEGKEKGADIVSVGNGVHAGERGGLHWNVYMRGCALRVRVRGCSPLLVSLKESEETN